MAAFAMPTATRTQAPTQTAAQTAAQTKAECVASNEGGQDLRRTGKLREARTSFSACVAASCPGAVREDCAQRLSEVDQAMPTLVFVATNSAGTDLSDVRVSMDGQPLLETLDGKATPIDPGEHRFHFEADGIPPKDERVVVFEGEKNRLVRFVLGASAVAGVDSKPAAVAPSGGGIGTQRAIGIGLGVGGAVAAVVGAIFGLAAKSTQESALAECRNRNANDCPIQAVNDSSSAHGQAAVSTLAFVAAGALVTGGVIVYLTAPGPNHPTVGFTVGDRAIGLRGAW